jgi:hypothetical protein
MLLVNARAVVSLLSELTVQPSTVERRTYAQVSVNMGLLITKFVTMTSRITD